MAAAWAALGLVFTGLVLAWRLVQLLAHVQRLHAIEEHLLEVLGKADDVAAVIQQDAVGFAGVRAGAQAPAHHLHEGGQALAQWSAIHYATHVLHIKALGQRLHADEHAQAGVRLGKLGHQHLALGGRGF